jgi:hypothetical protein
MWCIQQSFGTNNSHVAHTAEKRNAYRVLVGKPEGKRQTTGTPINIR